MRMRKSLAALAMLGSVGVAPQSHAGLVLDVTGGGAQPCGACEGSGTTFGWSFTVNSPITVDGIGVFDFFLLSFPASLDAGLWTGAGVLLESETITPASTPVASADSDGQWLFESFSPITLAPGDYLIGNVFFTDEPQALPDAPTVTIPQIIVTGGGEGTEGGGLSAPSDPSVSQIFGPTLETVAVPEASTWAMMLIGFIGISFAGYRASRRTAPAA